MAAKRKAKSTTGVNNERSKKPKSTTTTTTAKKRKSSVAPPKVKLLKGKAKKVSATTSKESTSGPQTNTSWMYELLSDKKWRTALAPCFQTPKFLEMEQWLKKQYKKEVFPPKNLIFNAFNLTAFDSVKVVILGQDPYHDDGQAHGLAFSVPRGIPIPPSLKNIYKELATDHPGFTVPDHGNLESWARQGVLLLNAALTVKPHEPNSHSRCGWWDFTDDVIRTINDLTNHTVFLLWGGFAHKKEKLVDSSKHTVIKTAHPSPLSFNRFSNCQCFSRVNAALSKHGQAPVDWKVV